MAAQKITPTTCDKLDLEIKEAYMDGVGKQYCMFVNINGGGSEISYKPKSDLSITTDQKKG